MSLQSFTTAGWRSPSFANKGINLAAKCWFFMVLLGQAAFSMYIVAFYYRAAFGADFLSFNQIMPAGYIEGDTWGNFAVIGHVVFAALITVGGLMQLVPAIRNHFPALHRWNGRLYIVIAGVMSLSGGFMILTRSELVAGDSFGHTALMINGLIILVCATMAFKFARERKFVPHRIWALRLFIAVSGVWMFRVGMMAWLSFHGQPVGFDPVSFSGPFLTVLNITTYIIPLLLLEVYLQAHARGSATQKLITAGGLFLLTLVMLGGVVAAIFGMWLPRI